MGKKKDNDIKALDELYEQVGSYRRGTDLHKLFKFMKKFPKIAPFNAFLLHIQKPGSQYVATASEWRKRFGRTIKPEARPLVILWPFSPVQFVFELEDTVGDAPFPEKLLRPFQVGGVLPPEALRRLTQNLTRDGVSYHEADHGTGSAGRIQTVLGHQTQPVGKSRVKVLYNLIVNKNHSNEEKFATIAHELAHLYCGHLGTPDEKWWPDRRGLSKNCVEFEAESVAWLVCERAGIKNPSAEYLSAYLDSEQRTPAISLEAVLRSAGVIEGMTHRQHSLRKELVVEEKTESVG